MSHLSISRLFNGPTSAWIYLFYSAEVKIVRLFFFVFCLLRGNAIFGPHQYSGRNQIRSTFGSAAFVLQHNGKWLIWSNNRKTGFDF